MADNRKPSQASPEITDFFKLRRRIVYLQAKLRQLNLSAKLVINTRGSNSNLLYRLQRGLSHNAKEEELALNQLVQILITKLLPQEQVNILGVEVKDKNANLHIYFGSGWQHHGHIVIDRNLLRVSYFREVDELHGRHNCCNIKLDKLFD